MDAYQKEAEKDLARRVITAYIAGTDELTEEYLCRQLHRLTKREILELARHHRRSTP